MKPTSISKIEFGDPITVNPGESLKIEFTYTINGMDCEITLITVDGQKIIVGDCIEDNIE
jgi:hypothetical protein